MKIEVFDVVELKNRNKATILDKRENKEYLSEVIDDRGKIIENKIIGEQDIERIIYSKE